MRAQVAWQINRVADCQQVKSAVGWPASLDEFRLIPLLREFDFLKLHLQPVMSATGRRAARGSAARPESAPNQIDLRRK
ncbi:hypothetical protein RLEG3_03520 (plasmid) [Rhizobium leguminosarum bv. trifolii WSM1689]|nr:hypothetical protein RLEG3_03520 [Rhizobium leguminosarum bv. trifolii WSM1689]